MKYKKIVLFFCIALPLSVIIRLLQLKYTIDTSTGFIKSEYQGIGMFMIIIIAAIAIVTAIFSMTAHRNPDNPLEPNIIVSISSVVMALTILYEIFTEKYTPTVRVWQSSLLIILGVFTAIYFIIFAIQPFFEVKIPDLAAVIPACYFIIQIICTFTSISSLALITDNLLLMASYCTTLIFMTCFAKLYNEIDTEKNFKKLLASGLSAIILCFTESVPHIIVNITTENSYLHTSAAANLSLFATGLFIVTFIFSYFTPAK